MYIDSHAHVYLPEFADDLALLLTEAADVGVQEVYMPNIDSSTIKSLHETEDRFANCKAMMGLHPCYVKENYKEEVQTVESWLTQRRYAALGEVGIDFYWDKTFVEEQQWAFERQIALAKEHGLAIIIHSRDSLHLTIDTISKYQDGSLRGIFHCFNGTVEQGQAIADLGFYMGIGGVVTFKNAGVDRVVEQLSLQNMVLETDAPYLSPVPYRGKRNTVGYTPLIAEKLASIHQVDVKEIAQITTDNCRSVFNY